jgi:hypothetical protein
MSQYDAAATPMFRSFSSEANVTPFVHELPRTNLFDVNVLDTPSAQKSAKFDFKKEDSIPDLEFSEVIWKAVKGEDSVMPAPRRAAILTTTDLD